MSRSCCYRAAVIRSADILPDPDSPPLWRVEAAAEVSSARVELRHYQLPRPSVMSELDTAPIFSAVEPRAEGTRGTVRFDGVPPCRVGRLLLRPGGVQMQSEGDGGALRILRCRFDPGFFARAMPFEHWDRAQLLTCAAIRARGVADASARLLAELRAPGFGGSLAIEALVQLLAIEIGRAFHAPPSPPPRRGGLAAWQMRRIQGRLAEADGDWPTTTELARLCGVSRSHLSRAFALTTGTTLAAYAADLRVVRAKALLTRTPLPIATIAHRLGFATPSAFGAAFRRMTGITPAVFRGTGP